MTHRKLAAPAIMVSLLALLAMPAAPTLADELEEVLARFDEVQRSLQTLSADFTETTSNELLKEPIVAEGHFYLTKPDRILWEYASPEEMRFVITRDLYTGYFPARKHAERRNIKRWSEKIFRFIGLGQASEELLKFYTISLETGEAGDEQSLLLVLKPKKKRISKRVTEVRFWLDPERYLPTRVEYLGKAGNTRVIEFREIQVNPDLAMTLYTVDLPADVKVTKGFGGFLGLSSEDYESTEN